MKKNLQIEVAAPPTESQGFITVWPPERLASKTENKVNYIIIVKFPHQAEKAKYTF